MRVSTLAFGLGLAFGGTALAQNPDPNVGVAHTGEMSATLTNPVDARRAKPGDQVDAALTLDAEGSGQVPLHRGTRLVGHVTEAQPRSKRAGSTSAATSAESRLGIVFDKAILDDGREVPVSATIQAIAEGEAAASGNAHDVASAGTTLGAGRASGSGPLGGGGIVGGVTGSAGAALGGAPSAGAGLGAAGSLGGAGRASAGAVGGLSVGGKLLPGSRGVFGLGGVDITTASGGGARTSTVLTSRSGNVALERGTQLVLAASERVTRE